MVEESQRPAASPGDRLNNLAATLDENFRGVLQPQAAGGTSSVAVALPVALLGGLFVSTLVGAVSYRRAAKRLARTMPAVQQPEVPAAAQKVVDPLPVPPLHCISAALSCSTLSRTRSTASATRCAVLHSAVPHRTAAHPKLLHHLLLSGFLFQCVPSGFSREARLCGRTSSYATLCHRTGRAGPAGDPVPDKGRAREALRPPRLRRGGARGCAGEPCPTRAYAQATPKTPTLKNGLHRSKSLLILRLGLSK